MSARPVIGEHPLTGPLTLLFAFACGAIAANLYYTQPLLALLAHTFGRRESDVGLLVTLTQIGYATGLALIVPLGDRLDRRRLICGLMALSVLALMASALSANFLMLAVLSIAVGLASCTAQLLVPLAATMADDATRGKAVGTVMSGLLLGILLARTVSGLIADLAGWRAVFVFASALSLLLCALLAWKLPHDRHRGPLAYGALMRSVLQLFAEQPVLRQRSLYGAFGFAAFSLFWTALSFLLRAPPYSLSESAIGAFGLIGAAGALAANAAGRLADGGRAALATRVFAALILLSFVSLWIGVHSMTALIVGVIVLDIGVQGLQITNQSVIYALDPQARSRITTVYLTSYFIGGALGSTAAGLAFAAGGWPGVCIVGLIIGAILCGLTLRQRR
ncbi:MFS transporter [Solimonas marina]|uniref:MFS transporter n=1 Tax=Solimonas marina TaxID=2714601 RepID=A0A970B5G6_9GAMM|nr:MFS transporter [Solimonas marina]NKF23377.1 MFS transporter [Solimonas marina]